MTWIRYSIRKAGLAVLGLAVVGTLGAAGCTQPMQDQMQANSQRWHDNYIRLHDQLDEKIRPSQHRLEPVLPDPAPDEATQARAWEPTVYQYPNGAVVAYPTDNPNYEERRGWLQNDYVYSAVQPAIVVADAVFIPIWVFIEPPWVDITYRGARYPASMTIAPPLPPE